MSSGEWNWPLFYLLVGWELLIFYLFIFLLFWGVIKKEGGGEVLVDEGVFDGDGSILETVSDMDRDPWRGVFVHCGLHCA